MNILTAKQPSDPKITAYIKHMLADGKLDPELADHVGKRSSLEEVDRYVHRYKEERPRLLNRLDAEFAGLTKKETLLQKWNAVKDDVGWEARHTTGEASPNVWRASWSLERIAWDYVPGWRFLQIPFHWLRPHVRIKTVVRVLIGVLMIAGLWKLTVFSGRRLWTHHTTAESSEARDTSLDSTGSERPPLQVSHRIIDGNRMELTWPSSGPGYRYRVYWNSLDGTHVQPVADDVTTPGAIVDAASWRGEGYLTVTAITPTREESTPSEKIPYVLKAVNNTNSVEPYDPALQEKASSRGTEVVPAVIASLPGRQAGSSRGERPPSRPNDVAISDVNSKNVNLETARSVMPSGSTGDRGNTPAWRRVTV